MPPDWLSDTDFSDAPLMKRARWKSISSFFFLPIARRSRSASPSE